MGKERDVCKELIELITEHLPEGNSLVNIICDVLNMHKESAYRRIRGEVKFNFEEVIKLTEALNLPIIRLIKESSRKELGIQGDLLTNAPVNKNDYCQVICELMEEQYTALYHCSRAMNTMSYNFIFKHEFLSRIHYYKWLSKKYTPFEHQYALSNEIPSKIRERQVLIQQYSEAVDSTYIFSDNMFESYCKEIQYFKFLGFITEEEYVQVKEELNKIVDEISNICTVGRFSTGKKVNIYIATVDINSSFLYIKAINDDLGYKEASIHFLHGTSHMISFAENIVSLSKDYFNHLLNSSTLITQSGAKYRLPYIAKLREIICAMK